MKLRFLKDVPEKRSGGLYLKNHVYEFPEAEGLLSLNAKNQDGKLLKIVEQVSDEEEVEITPMPYTEENNIEILELK